MAAFENEIDALKSTRNGSNESKYFNSYVQLLHIYDI